MGSLTAIGELVGEVWDQLVLEASFDGTRESEGISEYLETQLSCKTAPAFLESSSHGRELPARHGVGLVG